MYAIKQIDDKIVKKEVLKVRKSFVEYLFPIYTSALIKNKQFNKAMYTFQYHVMYNETELMDKVYDGLCAQYLIANTVSKSSKQANSTERFIAKEVENTYYDVFSSSRSRNVCNQKLKKRNIGNGSKVAFWCCD